MSAVIVVKTDNKNENEILSKVEVSEKVKLKSDQFYTHFEALMNTLPQQCQDVLLEMEGYVNGILADGFLEAYMMGLQDGATQLVLKNE